MIRHLHTEELEQGLEYILQSPKEQGTVMLIVRRPVKNEREVVEEAAFTQEDGLVGDCWRTRKSESRPNEPPDGKRQVTLMNARSIALIAGDQENWPWAGDQLYVDLDLSAENLPPGTQLVAGSTILEMTEPPHTGCKKFVQRFGKAAMLFVNSAQGRALNLRGVNAKVIQPGTIRVRETIHLQRN